jgi:predicted chitinase
MHTMTSLFSQFFDLFSRDRKTPVYVSGAPVLRTPQAPSVQPHALAPVGPTTLPPLKNWSHPFKDKTPPLLQLTHLAKAASGYYPLGRNGLWHGGVHFDGGTAGTLDQSSVHCLADGEVVAYRIDKHSPTTAYFVDALTVQKPFSRNFVLVRHRLEAPKIEGSPQVPPSLTFYSLYMHLQDWADYQSAPALIRPGFWPEGQIRRVRATVRDQLLGHPGQQGLNVRNQAQRGKVLALLPRGAEVTVSGKGNYRKLENTNGPDVLQNADGSLSGYLSISFLESIAGGEYRVTGNPSLNVRAEASARSAIIGTLPPGTQVTVSGDGEFRKLERVNQYVHFASLEGMSEPRVDRIVVLDQPVAIKAGELIGHIGEYQDSGAERPENKLHLEVFSGDDMEAFIEASLIWAKGLPATDKTWLKLAKGTVVVAHQDRFTATQPPTLRDASIPSDADLRVPKTLLDGLPADRKIFVPAKADRKACNWYRLDGLLHGANNELLNGWVREEVGVTPWVNPWSWEGYKVIFNYDTPRQALASFLRAANRFSEEQINRHGALADTSDKGPMKSRLYDIIDRNRDGKMTAEELQSAISLPAHAQSLSQLIIHYESEWRYTPHKWDALDEVLGHSGSTPHLNWLAEKERIKQMSWWGEVATKVGLPANGQVYHLHPVGLVGKFFAKCERITLEMLKAADPGGAEVNHSDILPYLNKHAVFYGLDQPKAVAHFLSQIAHESGFRIIEESLRYSARQMKKTYGCRTLNNQNGYDAVNDCCDFGVLRNKLWTEEESYSMNAENLGSYVYANRMGNGDEASKEGYIYRGRGMLQVTGKSEYQRFTTIHNQRNPADIQDFVSNPDLLVSSVDYGVESAFVFWFTKIGRGGVKLCELAVVGSVSDVTQLVNGGQNGFSDRNARFESLARLMGF